MSSDLASWFIVSGSGSTHTKVKGVSRDAENPKVFAYEFRSTEIQELFKVIKGLLNGAQEFF
jgi:hypothetical protein